MTTTKTPKAARTRTICLVCPPAGGVGVFRVTVGEETALYAMHEIPCEIGGRGFALHRLGIGELYHVRVGAPHDCSCECLGFLRHGHCRHILGLLTLVQHQLL